MSIWVYRLIAPYRTKRPFCRVGVVIFLTWEDNPEWKTIV
jgi:hypothetical protein